MNKIREAYDQDVIKLYGFGLSDDEVEKIKEVISEVGCSEKKFLEMFTICDHCDVISKTENLMEFPAGWHHHEYYYYDINLQLEEIRKQTGVIAYNIYDDMDIVWWGDAL